MKADKIRQIDDKEMAAKARENDEQIFRLKFQMSMGQMDGVKKYRELKKDRARINTILRERQIQAAKEAK